MKKNFLVRDIMTKDVISVSSDEKINDVAEKLSSNRIHGVPVLSGGEICGIITETDFFIKDCSNFYLPSYLEFFKNVNSGFVKNKEKKEKFDDLTDARAKDIMTSPCITILPEKTVAEAIKLMKQEKLTSLPVADKNNNLVGIVTTFDIIKLL